jgi:hypothetical protein
MIDGTKAVNIAGTLPDSTQMTLEAWAGNRRVELSVE